MTNKAASLTLPEVLGLVRPEMERVEEELARELGCVVRDERVRQELGRRALASATEFYGAGAATERFIELYRRLTEARR